MQQRRPRLEGKVAIVTGAGARATGPRAGTGKAISVTFAREGAKVLLVDRSFSNAEDTHASIQAEGGEASVFEGDVTNSAHCKGMVEAARERYGRLDILVNNAGIFVAEGLGVPEGSVIDVPEDLWDQVLTVNLKSMMLASKYAIPEIIKTGGWRHHHSVLHRRVACWKELPGILQHLQGRCYSPHLHHGGPAR